MGQGQHADEGAVRHDHPPRSLGGGGLRLGHADTERRGPFAWISQAWKEFSGVEKQADQGTGTRFSMLYSSGRVPIWKVAWKEFEGAPVLGVGADNFIFEYDRLREAETAKPQQAHSIELQVLGETGVIGGLFAFCAMLLAMGGILWPRCAAGWRGAKKFWDGRRKRSAPEDATPQVSSRFWNPRWGDTSIQYGWEMALFAGIAYWLIHASVDWLWQMAGVSIPMLLFLAAGVAAVDGRVDVFWPRWKRWLNARWKVIAPSEPDTLEGALAANGTNREANDSVFGSARRADRYLSRDTRRLRRQARRLRKSSLLQPLGLLSHVFRAGLVTLSVVVIVLTGLPYLSIQYQNSALAIAKRDGVRAVSRAESAHWLQPTDPGPYVIQAAIYTGAAVDVAGSTAEDRSGAVLDDLALSIGSFERAISVEPADWSLRYRAGVATINLLLASRYAIGQDPQIDYSKSVPIVPGLEDWSALRGTPTPPAGVGEAARSMAVDTPTQVSASRYQGDIPLAAERTGRRIPPGSRGPQPIGDRDRRGREAHGRTTIVDATEIGAESGGCGARTDSAW